jgi:hypothetical protein
MPQIAQIERVAADADFAPSAVFAPSFDEVLISGEPELMREPLRRWLARGDRAGANYVYEAWLKAGGEPELIRESLLQWLAGNAAAARTRQCGATINARRPASVPDRRRAARLRPGNDRPVASRQSHPRPVRPRPPPPNESPPHSQ